MQLKTHQWHIVFPSKKLRGRLARVGRAIAEMERQKLQIAATGRQLLFDFVLYHDLTADMRQVFASFLAHHILGPVRDDPAKSAVHVITLANIPARNRSANRLSDGL